MIIALLGYMGSGKSSIGAKLASDLGYNFIDLDFYIEQKEGLSISELFKIKGEIYFRKKEHEYLKELYSLKNKLVLATGGGTPCYYGNLDIINSQTSVYLKLLPKTIANRLFNEKSERPLISHIETAENLLEFIAIHLFERQNFYGKASLIINTDKLTIAEASKAIIKQLN